MARAAVSGRVANSGRVAVASRGASTRPRLSWVAADNVVAGSLLTLPSWLAIACATSGRTSQNGRSRLTTGLGANAARARDVGFGVGLSCESSRVNQLLNSDAWQTSWTAGSAGESAGKADPAGGSTATRFTFTLAANFSRYQQFNPASTWTIAAWASGVTLASGAYGRFNAYAGGPVAQTNVTSVAWQRYDLTQSTTGSGFQIYFDGGVNARASDVYGGQWEQGVLYPSSYIPTAGVAITRAADVLTVASPATIAPNGLFDIELYVAPNYAHNETLADHNLIYFDANNRLFFEQSTAKMALSIGGVTVRSAALTFKREQVIRLRATNLTGLAQLVVAGALTGNGTTAASSVPMTLPASAYLMGGSGGAEECADLRRVSLYL